MKKGLCLIGLSALLFSCGGVSSSEFGVSWTITFNVNGGSDVSPIKVNDGKTASKPTDPNKDGYAFDGWYIDEVTATPFDWDTLITADWTLFAKWKEASSPASSSSKAPEPASSSSSSPFDASKRGHGPTGSSLVSYYLVGEGSLWNGDWTIEDGVQLYSNPGNASDKGCLLDVYMEEGDVFKLTNGDEWFGYEKADSSIKAGLFGPSDDGFGGSNFGCLKSGRYSMYANESGKLWIEEA